MNASNACVETKLRTEVQSQMDMLDEELTRARALFENMLSRLETVTRSVDSDCVKADSCPQPMLVSHADSLRTFVSRLNDINNQYDSLIQRIEL